MKTGGATVAPQSAIRATAQYDRAVAEAKRTGKSQDVDGVTLNDEGIAGARIDADSHVAIEVAFNQPSYHFNVASGTMPHPSVLLRWRRWGNTKASSTRVRKTRPAWHWSKI